MSIVFVDVYDLWHRQWNQSTRRLETVENVTTKKALRNKQDTYIAIFGPGQEEYKAMFLKQTTWTILFQGIPARNKRPGYGPGGRNTIVVFEYNEPKA